MRPFHCVGGAGVYPFVSQESMQAHWQFMRGHRLSAQRASLTLASPLLEQDVLPYQKQQTEEYPPLRLVLCGVPWDGDVAFGHSLADLFSLQERLDAVYPTGLDRLAGDFSLSYLAPDSSFFCLYRSITSTRNVYYRVDHAALMWSTNPSDLFPDGKPTLDDVDPEMVAIMTATGQADPTRTCYREVFCVPPGDGLCWSRDDTRSTFHYDYHLREDNTHLPYDQAAKRLREHIEAAVSRTVSEFSSLNVLISGGLDTSIIAYEAARQGKALHGYHWTWSHGDQPLFHNEDHAAQAIVDQLGMFFHPIDFGVSVAHGSDYLRCMYGLTLPYNHAFYQCFSRTIATVHAVRQQGEAHLLMGGHLGDTLFQGDWADGFRFIRKRPRNAFRTLRDLLAWYPRGAAFAAWWYLLSQDQRDLKEHLDNERIEVHRTLMTPPFFERVLASGNMDYREQYAPAWKNLGARAVRASLRSSVDFNAHLETALTYRDGLTHNVVLRHPFSDQSLHEFCLSLGAHHRTRWYAGQHFSKFLLRLAYLGDLPPTIIKSECRTIYASVSEQFCFHNREELADIFSRESQLVRLGILDGDRIQEILLDEALCQKQSRSLVRMAGVEMWLRSLACSPLRSQEHSSQTVALQSQDACGAQLHQGQQSGVLALREGVLARAINAFGILVDTTSLEVCRLDEEAVHYWQVFCSESTWPRVFLRLHEMYPEETLDDIKSQARALARLLIEQGWAQACIGEEEEHGFSTNNRERL